MFQSYNDTVLSLGISHLSRNERTFSMADVSIGVDVLVEDNDKQEEFGSNGLYPTVLHVKDTLHPSELSFVTSIVAHSCIFNLKGTSAISHVPEIIACGRAALDGATSGGLFVITGCVSFSFLAFLCPCSIAAAVPTIPALGSAIYLQVLLPVLGLTMSMTEADAGSMNRVPPKNDEAVIFTKGDGRRLYLHILLKALPPAVAAHILYLIAFGTLILNFEPILVETRCSINPSIVRWTSVIQCAALSEYSGPARTSSSCLMLAELVFCIVFVSAGFVVRTKPLQLETPWHRNHAWLGLSALSVFLILVFLAVVLEPGSMKALPWYFFLLAFIMPLFCLFIVELVKRSDFRYAIRAERLRRLQFETRWVCNKLFHIAILHSAAPV